MLDRPPLDLRSHQILLARLCGKFGGGRLQEYEAACAEATGSPSVAYAHLLVKHFRGEADGELRETVYAHLRGLDAVGALEPQFAVRLDALLDLTGSRAEADWVHIATSATGAAERSRRAADSPAYDLALDTPLYYLDGGVEDAIEALERYRTANLWYSLALAPPLARPGSEEALRLVKREDELLAELRGLRLIRILPDLPNHYRRVTVDVSAMLGQQELGISELLDPARALDRLSVVQSELETIYRQLEAIDPGYARRRGDPGVTLDEFAALIRA
jgi:hypothetical protein